MKKEIKMEMQTVLDSNKLKELTNSTHTAIVTMLLLGLRERAREYSNVTATKEQLIRMGEKIVDEDYSKFWKDLEASGIGVLIIGRRGNPDRFKWHISLKNIARVAIEGKEELVKDLAKRKQDTKPVMEVIPSTPKKARSRRRRNVRAKATLSKRQRLTKEYKQIEKRILQAVRQALLS